MYDFSDEKDPNLAGQNALSWNAAVLQFVSSNLAACEAAGAFIEAHDTISALAPVREKIASSTVVTKFNDYLDGPRGVISTNANVQKHCPHNHLTQFNCAQYAPLISAELEDVLDILELLNEL